MNQESTIFRLDMSWVGDSGLSVTRTQPIFAYPAHSHTFYEISFYAGGQGTFHINALSLVIAKPTIVLMTPADYHGIQNADGDFYSLKVCFQESVLPDRKILPSSAFIYECKEDAQLLEGLFTELLRHEADVSYAAFILSAIVMKVTKGGMPVLPTVADPVYDHVAKAVKHINENFCDHITLAQTAQLLHISPQYLSCIFKKTLGVTFVAYVSQLRLHYSVQLLSQKNISITEIAFLCGFGNVSHFLRQFKKEFGISPGSYRKAHK